MCASAGGATSLIVCTTGDINIVRTSALKLPALHSADKVTAILPKPFTKDGARKSLKIIGGVVWRRAIPLSVRGADDD